MKKILNWNVEIYYYVFRPSITTYSADPSVRSSVYQSIGAKQTNLIQTFAINSTFTFSLNWMHEAFSLDPSSVPSCRTKFSLSRYFHSGEVWRLKIWFTGYLYAEMNKRKVWKGSVSLFGGPFLSKKIIVTTISHEVWFRYLNFGE